MTLKNTDQTTEALIEVGILVEAEGEALEYGKQLLEIGMKIINLPDFPKDKICTFEMVVEKTKDKIEIYSTYLFEGDATRIIYKK